MSLSPRMPGDIHSAGAGVRESSTRVSHLLARLERRLSRLLSAEGPARVAFVPVSVANASHHHGS